MGAVCRFQKESTRCPVKPQFQVDNFRCVSVSQLLCGPLKSRETGAPVVTLLSRVELCPPNSTCWDPNLQHLNGTPFGNRVLADAQVTKGAPKVSPNAMRLSPYKKGTFGHTQAPRETPSTSQGTPKWLASPRKLGDRPGAGSLPRPQQEPTPPTP